LKINDFNIDINLIISFFRCETIQIMEPKVKCSDKYNEEMIRDKYKIESKYALNSSIL
jgi:hypothetical protein